MSGKNTRSRPRVLLVDDHRQVLNSVSALLAEDFDVVGIASDGYQALDTARHANPDVMVLDIDMPGLDGFQTLRALTDAGFATTPVVFLSMHDADEVISAAFGHGGRGYVLKPRVGRDLASALDQALLGRLFVPSLTGHFRLADSSAHHVMQLHSGVDALLDDVADVFDLALQRGDATCVMATEPVRTGLGHRLKARGWDMSADDRCLVIDAADALHRFMRDGLPDREQLAQIAAELDQYRVAVAGPASRLTIFGNMVMLLSAAGNAAGVVTLENLWNAVTQHRPFFTLCGYTTSCFHDGVPDLWSDTRREHSALSHARDV